MNDFQNNLYRDLMNLCSATDSPFYFIDTEMHSVLKEYYRIFNYRLATFEDFKKPNALNCRGTMFRMRDSNQPDTLASLPMEKFFNVHEGEPASEDDLVNSELVMEKMDGSLISTYTEFGEVYCKSKASLTSEQAIKANIWVAKSPLFRAALEECVRSWYTVNMEWVAPDNRIVVGYSEPRLVVLNCRDNLTGNYMPHNIAKLIFKDHYVPHVNFVDTIGKRNWIRSVPSMENIEGFVIRLANGRMVKYKTEWYVTRHRLKDTINNARHLFEAVVDEATDDIRELFVGDELAIEQISAMEKFVSVRFNRMVKAVEEYHAQNKHLSRKEYAILGKMVLEPMYFSLAMCLYTNKPVDYKEYFKGYWDDAWVHEWAEYLLDITLITEKDS